MVSLSLLVFVVAALTGLGEGLKVLCLSGGGQSGAELKSSSGMIALEASLPNATFVYANGAYAGNLWVPDPPGGKGDPTTDPNVAQDSMLALDTIVNAQGPFDAILGYSQGSMFVSAYLSHAALGTFKAAVMFCGYLPTTHQGLLNSIQTAAPFGGISSLVWMGASDFTISNAMTIDQGDLFTNPTVLTSAQGGHAIPDSSDSTYSNVVSFLSNINAPKTGVPTTGTPTTGTPTTGAPTSFNCNSLNGKGICKANDLCFYLNGKCRNKPPPTPFPTRKPTASPTTKSPTQPTRSPTTREPTSFPTRRPTRFPTNFPTRKPTKYPTTRKPTLFPTESPTPVGYVPPTKEPTTSAPTPGSRTLEGSLRLFGTDIETVRSRRAFWQNNVLGPILNAKDVTVSILPGSDSGSVEIKWYAEFATSGDRLVARATVNGDFEEQVKVEMQKDSSFDAQVDVDTDVVIISSEKTTRDAGTGTNPLTIVGVSLAAIIFALAVALAISFKGQIVTTIQDMRKHLSRQVSRKGDIAVHQYASSRDIRTEDQGRGSRWRGESSASGEAPRIGVGGGAPPPPVVQEVSMGSRNASAASATSAASAPSVPDLNFNVANPTRSFSPQFSV